MDYSAEYYQNILNDLLKELNESNTKLVKPNQSLFNINNQLIYHESLLIRIGSCIEDAIIHFHNVKIVG